MPLGRLGAGLLVTAFLSLETTVSIGKFATPFAMNFFNLCVCFVIVRSCACRLDEELRFRYVTPMPFAVSALPFFTHRYGVFLSMLRILQFYVNCMVFINLIFCK